MKRSRFDDSDDDTSSSSGRSRSSSDKEDENHESQLNPSGEPVEEIPKWIRYLPQRKYLKLPTKVGQINTASDAFQHFSPQNQPRHRADSDISGNSSIYSIEYSMNINDCQLQTHSSNVMDVDIDTNDTQSKRKKRRVTFVELVPNDATAVTTSKTDELLPEKTGSPHFAHSRQRHESFKMTEKYIKNDTDGVSLLFGEENRTSKTHIPLSNKDVSITEASLLLEFSGLS